MLTYSDSFSIKSKKGKSMEQLGHGYNWKVTTCEGNDIVIDKYCKFLRVPLKQIKKYEYCEILGREIPIQFIETFEMKEFFYCESKEEYEKENYVTFTVWQSQGIT